MRCDHEHDDGAYVLGALSPTERRAFEDHLATCSFCREAVRDMATLPDMLSRLDAKEFARLVDPSVPLFESPAHRVTPGKRRWLAGRRKKPQTRSGRVLTGAAAVIVAALVAALVVWTPGSEAEPGSSAAPPAAMTAVDAQSPITATVKLTSAAGGTRVDMLCTYSRSAEHPYTFRLMAYGRDAEQEPIGSWQAFPGATFPMMAATHFPYDSLSRLELVRYDGTALLTYNVP